MASDNPSIKRDNPVIKSLPKGSFDTIYPEGEIINIDSNDTACYIVRQGSVMVEMLLPAPDGLKKIELDNIEAGEYFNVNALFNIKLDNKIELRYRAQCQTVIMRVTLDMLPKDPQKLSKILASFIQTAIRREDKLRQLTGYALQRAEEKKSDRKNSDILFIQSLHEEIEETTKKLETVKKTNSILSRNKQVLEIEIRSVKESLNFEKRMRLALEKRVSELTKLLAERDKIITQTKFPSTFYLLESRELRDLEEHAKRFREAAKHFEDMTQKMHRAVELMAQDNPGMYLSVDVMMLLTGEEPPARDSVVYVKADRDEGGFKTLSFGSQDPVLSDSRATNTKHSKTEKPTRLSQNEMQNILSEFSNNPVSTTQKNNTRADDETWGVDDSVSDFMETLGNNTTSTPSKHSTSQIQTSISPFVDFPEEDTDIRQIQEDWRQTPVQNQQSSVSVQEALDDMDWVDSQDMRTTKAYQFSDPDKPPLKPKP